MDPRAIDKARIRLGVAEKAIADLANCKDLSSFKGVWYTFLFSTKGIYTTLEQGSKPSAQSRQWFGGKKNERKSDPMLQYLYQARDDDEHGLEDGTEHVPGSLSVGGNEPGFSTNMHVRLRIGSPGEISVDTESFDGKPVLSRIVWPHIALTTVRGRDKGNIYPPPTVHAGQPIADTSPAGVARLAVTYFRILLDEAALL